MAVWDFGPDAAGYTLDPTTEHVVGTPTLTVLGGDYDADGKNGLAYWDAAETLHPGGQAVAWDDVSAASPNLDAEWTITINTTGWRNIVIRWDYFSDNVGGNRGPTTLDLAYRVGDGAWFQHLNNAPIIRDDAWHPFDDGDLSAIAAIENQPLVVFRISDLDRNDEDGDFMFDNLELTGVPEPCSIVLLGLGGFMLLRKRSR
jgi:hypothetical protein